MQKLAANLTEKMLRRKLISPEQAESVSYTHLTLPTKLEV